MSAFEVTITPTRIRNAQRQETRTPVMVCMAPFSSKSIVEFQDVPLTKTAKRMLRIMNPSEEDIQVTVKKSLPAEHNLTMEWTEKVVPAMGEVEMELIWVPQMDVACKEKIQLKDNRNFHKDVEIILKSKNNTVKTTRKFPTLSSSNSSSTSSYVKTLRLKSPKNNMKSLKRTNAVNTTQMQQKTNPRSQSSATTVKGGKTSLSTLTTGRQPLAESNLLRKIEPPKVSNATLTDCNISPLPLNNELNNVLKENVSPLETGNMLDMIDNLNFTPITAINKSQVRQSSNNLTFLPTPVNTTTITTSIDLKTISLKPRKLTVNELEGLSPTNQLPRIEISYVETNKTYNVQPIEELNLTHELLETPTVGPTIMNCTTTIQCTPMGRTLTIIKEEDDGLAYATPQESPSTNTLSPNNYDLKRDIKLVGTPLRKYSESMKDLSLKSPQNKLAIQGSMPNLNEMETIRSIEQNRYFHQSGSQQTLNKKRMSTVIEQQSPNDLITSHTEKLISSHSNVAASNVELNFDLQEITAQSSRFNLHEVGIGKKNLNNSPNSSLNQVKKQTQNNTKLMISPRAKGAVKKLSPNQQLNETPLTTLPRKKRSLHEISYSDTRSVESLASSTDSSKLKVVNRANSYTAISPPKRQRIETNYTDDNFTRPTPVNASKRDWSRVQPKKVPRLAQTLSVVKKPITPNKTSEQRIQLYDPDTFLQACINPDPFAATTTCDPFLASTMYLDPQAIERHKIDFRKWLNALVTMPEDLDADSNTKIDVGRLFNEVRNKELTLAPTKEQQSVNYLTKFRLDSLRRAAIELFLSEEIRVPCSKIAVYVTKQALRIRQDRNLHLDVVMQRNLLELLLCFNPLWLRLGLEVVFGEQIYLHSNRDIVGLSTFILNRLFRDKCLEQKYSKAYTLSDEYAEHIKKFTLQKMLFLLLFLDKAKSKRIIKHNPCLFVKKSPHKETKEILLRFSSELLANVGDITRELKRFGYVLQHKQNYLDEFDYAFNNIALDLRDGVRLNKVMEIILLRDDLTQQLRVPAVSRLQRIFNVNLALRALSEADFELSGNITAADIVDAHREKTLSLLWQIIYKFRSPKFHAAARTIQIWWRKNWLRIIIRRRVQQKEIKRRELAATKIQAYFRGFISRRYVKVYKTERINAAIVLQKYVRRYLTQKHLVQANNAAISIQRFYRAHLLKRQFRQYYLRLRECTIFLQRVYRRRLLRRKLLLLAAETIRQREQKRNAAATHIQYYWRAFKKMRGIRTQYLKLRKSVLIIQQHYRACLAMRHERYKFIKLRQTVIFIQQKFKAKQLMRQQRQIYLEKRTIVIKLQRRRRAQLQMRLDVQAYKEKRLKIIKLQQRIRATLTMRAERVNFQRLRAAACILQQRYRALLVMKAQQAQYQHIRDSIIVIQRKWRATMLARRLQLKFITLQYWTILLQQRFRAKKLMRLERSNYLKFNSAVISIQRRYRAKREMFKVRNEFQHKIKCIITLQRHFRAYKAMRFQRAKFQGTKNAVVCLQQHIRAYLVMRRKRDHYQRLKSATIFVQRLWRAKLQMRRECMYFKRLRTSAINVQIRFRGKLKMRREMLEFQRKRQLIIAMQRCFRAKLYARKVRQEYQRQYLLIVKAQRRYRANRAMQTARQSYIYKRSQIIKIQRYFRSYLLMKLEQKLYKQKRNSIIKIQRWYRSILKMRQQQIIYQDMRSKIMFIQQKWRATLAASKERREYLRKVEKIIFIQLKFRATLEMRAVSAAYQKQKIAAIILQQRYRARLEMLKIRSQYLLILSLTMCLQRKFKARKAMRKEREHYLLLRRTTIHLQQKFRGKRLMQKERTAFLCLRQTVPKFQAYARGFLARRRFQALMTPEMVELLRQKRAAKIIQRYFRGYRIRKRLQNTCLLAIRRKIIALKATANVMNSIRYKLKDSVRILRDRFSMAEVLSVLHQLERLSRIVPHLLVAHSDFISTYCYGIMAQAIRSEIDKKMIELCSRIILNLARYDSVNLNTFQKHGLVTIAQMLLRWCDKDCEIFNTLCTLVWIFAHCEKKRKIIREFMTNPEAIYMLRETKKLVARKEKMKSNDRRQIAFLPNSTRSIKEHKFQSSRALPSLEPDYGIIQKKPYTFVSSVYAFDTVLCKLDLDVYKGYASTKD